MPNQDSSSAAPNATRLPRSQFRRLRKRARQRCARRVYYQALADAHAAEQSQPTAMANHQRADLAAELQYRQAQIAWEVRERQIWASQQPPPTPSSTPEVRVAATTSRPPICIWYQHTGTCRWRAHCPYDHSAS
ncbi:hypothetical protein H4R34_002528 [Dimargaris verticillata]|uniref:C3H1-type domain-containing protein n=1 Tax=Dimargaris verticillata TaxID=2761393 RepID=A0A9W8ECU0_9FUNG|nr:hypothetical protein H4R34_002528 [Dimargaris verticillata]